MAQLLPCASANCCPTGLSSPSRSAALLLLLPLSASMTSRVGYSLDTPPCGAKDEADHVVWVRMRIYEAGYTYHSCWESMNLFITKRSQAYCGCLSFELNIWWMFIREPAAYVTSAMWCVLRMAGSPGPVELLAGRGGVAGLLGRLPPPAALPRTLRHQGPGPAHHHRAGRWLWALRARGRGGVVPVPRDPDGRKHGAGGAQCRRFY